MPGTTKYKSITIYIENIHAILETLQKLYENDVKIHTKQHRALQFV